MDAALRYPKLLQQDGQTLWYASDVGNGAVEVVGFNLAQQSRVMRFGLLGEFQQSNGAFVAVDLQTSAEQTVTAIIPTDQTINEPPNTSQVRSGYQLMRENETRIFQPNLLTDHTAFVGWIENSQQMLLLARDASAKLTKTLLRWDVATGEMVTLAEDVLHVTASRSAERVAFITAGKLFILDTQSGATLHQFSAVDAVIYWLTDTTLAFLDSSEQWQLFDTATDVSAALTTDGGILLDQLDGSATGRFLSARECIGERCRVVVLRNPLR